jgi:hypothetical protein
MKPSERKVSAMSLASFFGFSSVVTLRYAELPMTSATRFSA